MHGYFSFGQHSQLSTQTKNVITKEFNSLGEVTYYTLHDLTREQTALELITEAKTAGKVCTHNLKTYHIYLFKSTPSDITNVHYSFTEFTDMHFYQYLWHRLLVLFAYQKKKSGAAEDTIPLQRQSKQIILNEPVNISNR